MQVLGKSVFHDGTSSDVHRCSIVEFSSLVTADDLLDREKSGLGTSSFLSLNRARFLKASFENK